MAEIKFNKDFDPQYGALVRVGKNIRRVVAQNPGPFTGPGTGTYIIGNDEVSVIDPGPMMPQHVDAILEGLGGEQVSHIVVTHTHTDHSPAAKLLSTKTGAPILALGPHSNHHAGELEGGVDRDFEPDFTISDGEVINGLDWQLQAIHTPGHCSNHLCFALLGEDALFCGDQLMAWSTTVILPPDGSIQEYLDSLKVLAERSEGIFYPTHGTPITDPRVYIAQTIEHRLARAQQILSAIQQGISTNSQLREFAYPAIPRSLFAGAELSIQATVDYLRLRGDIE